MEFGDIHAKVFRSYKRVGIEETATRFNSKQEIIEIIVEAKERMLTQYEPSTLNTAIFEDLINGYVAIDLAEKWLLPTDTVTRRLRFEADRRGLNYRKILRKNKKNKELIVSLADALLKEEIAHEPKIGDVVDFEEIATPYDCVYSPSPVVTRGKIVSLGRNRQYKTAKIVFAGHFGKVFTTVHLSQIKEVLGQPKKESGLSRVPVS